MEYTEIMMNKINPGVNLVSNSPLLYLKKDGSPASMATETGPKVATACCKASSNLAFTLTKPVSFAPTFDSTNAHFPYDNKRTKTYEDNCRKIYLRNICIVYTICSRNCKSKTHATKVLKLDFNFEILLIIRNEINYLQRISYLISTIMLRWYGN